MKTKRTIYNTMINIASTILTLALGIIIPRLFLVSLGSETNGLVQSVGQIFSYVGLLEAGIGATAIQVLYAPVSRGDFDEINRILAASGRYYKKIGLIYMGCIFAIAIVYPCIVNTEIPTPYVVGVIIFSGLGGAINFLFQQNYIVLLAAEGKGYITVFLNMIVNIVSSLIKVVMLLMGYNVVLVLAGQFCVTLVRILLLRIYIKKGYTWIDTSVPPKKEALNKQKYVMIQQLSYFVYSNTDVMILTLFCNLKAVSVYSIYVMIVGTLEALLSTLTNSISFAFGQLYAEDRVKFKTYFTVFDAVYTTILFSLFTVMYLLVTPFLRLYTSGITDVNYIDPTLAFLFCIMKMVGTMRSQSQNAINFAGAFQETQRSSIIEAILNIVISLVAVQFWGIHGVVTGSIISTLYKSLIITHYSHCHILEYDNKESRCKWIRWILNFVLFGIIIVVMDGRIDQYCTSYIGLLGVAVIIAVCVIVIFFILMFLVEKSLFHKIKLIVSNYLESHQ